MISKKKKLNPWMKIGILIIIGIIEGIEWLFKKLFRLDKNRDWLSQLGILLFVVTLFHLLWTFIKPTPVPTISHRVDSVMVQDLIRTKAPFFLNHSFHQQRWGRHL